MNNEYFKGINKIQYEGVGSDNPLAFKHYDENLVINGKTLKEHFNFAVAYWHSFGDVGGDPFGSCTKQFSWVNEKDPIAKATKKMDAAFEFITKIGAPYYCFHDFDLIDEGSSIAESNRRLEIIKDYALAKQKETGVNLLWGTSNLFNHPRYMNGAASNPDFRVLAHAGAQVKKALDITIELGGKGFVFWGGREGYMSLLNTNMKKERENIATFYHMVKDYARKNGFKGKFLIEPKPMEPSKHQYDFDAATVIGFLREFDLMDDFSLNIEVNHATLAHHSFQHELQVAADANMLGSIDANRGDYQNGWDTDQFPNNVQELIEAMLVVIEAGGFSVGGVNFDAKVRRNSTDTEDLFIAHIAAMDTFARAYISADKLLKNSMYKSLREKRYRSFDSGNGKLFREGNLSLEDISKIAQEQSEIELISGKQELYESLIQNSF